MSSANAGNVAGGHKANLNNPNTSEEAKQHSLDVLEDMGVDPSERASGGYSGAEATGTKNTGNVIGGHKANLNNPNTSKEAKQHSRQVLDELEADERE